VHLRALKLVSLTTKDRDMYTSFEEILTFSVDAECVGRTGGVLCRSILCQPVSCRNWLVLNGKYTSHRIHVKLNVYVTFEGTSHWMYVTSNVRHLKCTAESRELAFSASPSAFYCRISILVCVIQEGGRILATSAPMEDFPCPSFRLSTVDPHY